MNYIDKYNFWRENPYFDEQTRRELEDIKDNVKEIEERFYKDLEFGTGGLRGIIGAGTNRMNVYTVAKATQGLANYLLKNEHNAHERGVVIAYDSRHKSPDFALKAALVLCANGIKSYLFDELRPTPELSFAVRYLKAAAGIVITASHNPKQYNGYKVYGADGGQLPLGGTEAVIKEIYKIEDITSIPVISEQDALNRGLLNYIGQEIDDEYIKHLKTLSININNIESSARAMKIIYTPLHGTGTKPVMRILKETGFDNILIVKEQQDPDPDFSTVKSPNPEEKSAFEIAIKMAQKENVDLIIGTDPDSDRVGVVVKNKTGEYVVLTGNQTGCLLMEYILSQKAQRNEMPENPFVVKTIVTTELARKIAAFYNVALIEVLTGFKFIGEKIKELDENGDMNFIFGFEESYGYLAGTFVRDKDAVVASMLIAEMAAFYRQKGMTLYEGLIELFEKYGYFMEGITSFDLEGKEGTEKIEKAMQYLREKRPRNFGNYAIKAFRDYEKGLKYNLAGGNEQKLDLPKSNVLYYETEDGSWFCVRPSGTEPKIKIYYGVSTDNADASIKKLESLKSEVVGFISKCLE